MSPDRRSQYCFGIIGLLYALVAFSSPSLAGVQELLADINRKSPEERQRILVEGAKKEGEVTLYAATNLSDTRDVISGFNKQYPFIEVKYSSLGGMGVLNKVLTEDRAGVYHADVVTLTGFYAAELISKKLVAKYKSPMVPFLRKGFVDSEGLWPGVYAIGYTIIYNTNSVKPAEVPTSYEDLLKPRWKGRMIMDVEAVDLLAGLIDQWGEKKAVSFLRKLARGQDMRFSRESHTAMTQLVAAGERDLIVDGYVHNAVKLKSKGAPIDLVFMNPTILRPPSVIAVTSRSSHPHAAALLFDYHLSKEASEIMAQKQGRWTPRKDVKWQVEPDGDVHVVSIEWAPKMRGLVSIFQDAVGTK